MHHVHACRGHTEHKRHRSRNRICKQQQKRLNIIDNSQLSLPHARSRSVQTADWSKKRINTFLSAEKRARHIMRNGLLMAKWRHQYYVIADACQTKRTYIMAQIGRRREIVKMSIVCRAKEAATAPSIWGRKVTLLLECMHAAAAVAVSPPDAATTGVSEWRWWSLCHPLRVHAKEAKEGESWKTRVAAIFLCALDTRLFETISRARSIAPHLHWYWEQHTQLLSICVSCVCKYFIELHAWAQQGCFWVCTHHFCALWNTKKFESSSLNNLVNYQVKVLF